MLGNGGGSMAGSSAGLLPVSPSGRTHPQHNPPGDANTAPPPAMPGCV